jgi:hypothetical protein
MGEYQYYEFQAVNRPLSEADRQVLRGLSTRARITTTSFTNSYDWGNFKGNPVGWMERCSISIFIWPIGARTAS